MRQDKKALAGRLTFVLPVEIGVVKIFNDISENMVRDALFNQKY
jgi:3-dehydroquinate synthase